MNPGAGSLKASCVVIPLVNVNVSHKIVFTAVLWHVSKPYGLCHIVCARGLQFFVWIELRDNAFVNFIYFHFLIFYIFCNA